MSSTEIVDQIEFWGHKNILGTHYNTLELTREPEITKRADCIIGVSASKACANLLPEVKDLIWQGKTIRFSLRVEQRSFSFDGRGSKELPLSDEREIVLRKSEFISGRTGAVRCSAAAIDVPRPFLNRLRNPEVKGVLEIRCVR